MSENAIHLRLKINFPVIFFTVLLVHLFLMLSRAMPHFTMAEFLPKEEKTTLNIRRVKTQRVENARVQALESFLNDSKSVQGPKTKPTLQSPVSLKDLALNKPLDIAPMKMPRPGTRPEIGKTGKGPGLRKVAQEMNKMSLKSQEFKNYSKSFPSGGLAISDMISATQKISDAVVSIEVPEGVEPDELNEWELMFYGFQKRTALNYINSILSNLDKFQKKYPHYQLPSNGRITMTARVTYDPEGNVMQIKMVRWTHVNELQAMFEDIVKDIDQLHNPPKKLWEKNNEFSMFYTLEIVNG